MCETSSVFFDCSPPFVFEIDFSLNLELMYLARLVCQWVSGSTLVCIFFANLRQVELSEGGA